MHPFRAAVEAHDMDAAVALLADDVVFRSPVVHTPYQGREVVGRILRTVETVFQDFHYVREIGEADAPDHALVFNARVGGLDIEGLDVLHTRPDGVVDELVVLLRPLNATMALAQAMREALERA